MIYIDESEQRNLAEILNKSQLSGSLTVSCIKDFIKKGGLVEFVKIHHHLRFKINNQMAKKNGIKISSFLLELAER